MFDGIYGRMLRAHARQYALDNRRLNEPKPGLAIEGQENLRSLARPYDYNILQQRLIVQAEPRTVDELNKSNLGNKVSEKDFPGGGYMGEGLGG